MSQSNHQEHSSDNAPDRRRRSIRLKGYDYSQPGAYFVTIVTRGRVSLFGEIVGDEMRLNDAGKIVQDEWERLSQRFKFIVLGTYIIMPNHFHAIIMFVTVPRPNEPPPASLGVIIGQFKSRVTKRLWKIPSLTGVSIWQRNYYEHIIRSEEDANRIHLYIESNPSRWDDDDENLARQP